MPRNNWTLFAIVGFILFIGSVFWVIYDLYIRLKAYEEARPSIKVEPIKMDQEYYVEVTNVGESAEFEGQVDVLGGYDKSASIFTRYSTWWRNSSDKTTILKKGQKAQLLIADIDVTSLYPQPALSFRLYYYSPDDDMNVRCMHSR